jgi:ribonuclease P protein component
LTTKKYSFSKAKRLQTPADFQAVFSQPIRSKSTCFTILARPNQSECARLGAIITKRIIKRAVHRHEVRRVVRESFRTNQELLVGLDIIVLVRCVIPRKQNQVLFECLKQQWQELVGQWKKG